MFCVRCGAKLEYNDAFCSNCGEPVQGAVSVTLNKTADSINSIAAESAKQIVETTAGVTGGVIKGKFIFAVIVMAIVAAGTILYNMYLVEKPSKVVYTFVNAINDKDINTAVSCLDPKNEKMYNAASNIISGFIGVNVKDVVDLLPFLAETSSSGEAINAEVIKIVNVVSEQVTDDNATVVVKIDILDAAGNKVDSQNVPFYLQKFDSGWRILDITFES